ncbi:MAG: tyrosine-type recombinase/integrase [Nanobdellota archaeon]
MRRESAYPIKFLSFEEWEKLKSFRKLRRDDLILTILYSTGCTVNELVNIRLRDISFSKGTLTIRKSNSRNKNLRHVYLSSKVLKKIEDFVNENDSVDYLFSTRQSSKMSTKRVRQIIQNLCSKIKIKDATPQIIRYTHIAHAYKKNIPVDAILKQVGLRRSRAIEIFNQLRPSNVEDAYREFEI